MSAETVELNLLALQSRKDEIVHRLQQIAVPVFKVQPKKKAQIASPSDVVNVVPVIAGKTDTHWDFLLKEMQWLAADFQAERKRHAGLSKKLAVSVAAFAANAEARHHRSLQEAEMKRRKLAARISRDCLKSWSKIDRVISYKQKVSYDVSRQAAMDQQLVQLVQQTEKYTLFLGADDPDSSILTIEQALASTERRRSKHLVRDYTRLLLEQKTSGGETSLYGESTEDSGSDATFSLDVDDDNSDDESTLRAAELEERRERKQQGDDFYEDDTRSFVADPVELRKLQEEGEMELEKVLQRLREEGESGRTHLEIQKSDESNEKRVQFAVAIEDVVIDNKVSMKPVAARRAPDPGSDADDDMDASDVEDYQDAMEEDDQDDEFVADDEEVDDETTLDKEEMLPQEITELEEIQLLEQENELTIEELRKRYAVVLAAPMRETNEDATALQYDYSGFKPAANGSANAYLTSGAVSTVDQPQSKVEEIIAASEDEASGSDFVRLADDVGDEFVLGNEVTTGRNLPCNDELEHLKVENEIPIEHMRAIDHRRNDNFYEDVESEADNLIGDDPVLLSTTQLLADGSLTGDADSSEEYEDEEAFDDEKTMEAEEKLGRDMSYEEEIAMLDRENEMSIDELRAMYTQKEEEVDEEDDVLDDKEALIENSNTSQLASDSPRSIDDQENDGDFSPDEDIEDDELTIAAEERLGREISAEEEITMLQKESELPVDEFRSMYQMLAEGTRDIDSLRPSSTMKRKRREEADADDKKRLKHQDAGVEIIDKFEVSATLAKSTIASRPFLIPAWVKLREYQHIGLNWLVSLQSRRLNGILADEMGLGKTLQTISLLAYLAAYKGIWGPHLIVVPTSVILNWETELKRFCPALKVLCYYGSAKRRKELRTGWTKSNWYHVVVTSYQLAVQDSFAFKRKRWYYFVLDEAQHIKNFQSQRWQTLISFNTQRRLLLTGTPLQNNLMELWSLLHFLMPYIFRSRKEFSYWFANPMNSMIEGTLNENADVVQRLHKIIRPFVLRRLKKDVETQMPGKFEHIVKCQLSRRQMFIYEEFMARSSTRHALKKGSNFMGMMNVLMQLRKVTNHPDLFEPRSVVTPFVVDPIIMPMAPCVIGISAANSVLARVSDALISPLWSGSQGTPSIDAGLRHDVIESDELLKLEASFAIPCQKKDDCKDGSVCSALMALAEEIYDKDFGEKCDSTKFINKLNTQRCRAVPFAYPRRLINAIYLLKPPLQQNSGDVLGSPAHLLAMRRDQQERADDVGGLIKRFVFAVPKAGAQRVAMAINSRQTGNISEAILNEVLLEPLQECLLPFREAHARLTSFFPDKKLIQFDAGKLQALAELLRERKRGGHKVLIFTQMSKMLDILEAFLNMNGHTYVRLDGSTSVDQRQRLMDRFNNDPKIFCFILSTRSGGTGVNLIGADTVVFYDSDWNPAQDAQAQDRAHRIGQTREVHIFRLVTEHTIEENILIKAKQKRNLDILVMDRGQFDALQLQSRRTTAELEQVNDLYSKGGLRAILGVSPGDDEDSAKEGDDDNVSSDQIEKAMTSLEDVDDVNALRGARKEAAEALQEFDESIEYKKDSDSDDDDEAKAEQLPECHSKNGNASEDPKSDEKELEKELASWQEKVGTDASVIEASLSPVERYCLRFHEDVDPYYSIFAVMEYRRKMEAQIEKEDEIDVDEIEREKAREEIRAFDDGGLLATTPRPGDLIRQRSLYRREKARLSGSKKRRRLTGENWESRADAMTQNLFWYNIDTGEAVWDKPKVLLEMEAYDLAYQRKWAALPIKPMIHIMSFLSPFPDRMRSSEVCTQWCKAATDVSFVRHIYPVEMGAYTREDAKMECNHYRTIEDALKVALPGDTIELGDGHYWQNSDMLVEIPLRIIGDEDNLSNVIVEMSGTIIWRAGGGFFEGITFRRPKISSSERPVRELLRVEEMGKLNVIQSMFDNEGSSGDVVMLFGPGYKGRWVNISVQHGSVGICLRNGAQLELLESVIAKNEKAGISCEQESNATLIGCTIEKNGEHGIDLKGESRATIRRSRVVFNGGSVISKELGCGTICSGNVCTRSSQSPLAPPGFHFLVD